MRVAVMGYGKMGHEIESLLRERGHEPVPQDPLVRPGTSPFPDGCVVGIDFTQADAVLGNVQHAMHAGARYVVGTTGWYDHLDAVRQVVELAKGGFVYAPNFSLGVNLFYRIVRNAAALLAAFPNYDPYVFERHHRQKKDAPSGTANALAQIIESAGGRRRTPARSLERPLDEDQFHVSALRAGGIVGDHTVGFDAGGDEILLEHRTRSRQGFALGAVLAAEWIATRTGFHTFDTVLNDLGSR